FRKNRCVVDSSGWVEYFADGTNASVFAEAVEETTSLLIPTISFYEVYKRIIEQKDESCALQAVATMRQGHVLDLDISTAILAGKLSLQFKLPMADSVILASTRLHHAILWTQDSDFEGIENVKYIPKKK